MTLLGALLLAQAPATAADFFPLVSGVRRTYELVAEGKSTVVAEVADTAYFDDKPAIAIVRKNPLGGPIQKEYYRVEGSTVLLVGYGQDRRGVAKSGETTPPVKKEDLANVLLPLVPAMPLFKYDGGPTSWNFADVPKVEGRAIDPISIAGTAKPGVPRTVLGRRVDTLEVKAEVRIGNRSFVQTIVETTVYGRGIGLIESSRKSTIGKQSSEVKTKLIDLQEKREGA